MSKLINNTRLRAGTKTTMLCASPTAQAVTDFKNNVVVPILTRRGLSPASDEDAIVRALAVEIIEVMRHPQYHQPNQGYPTNPSNLTTPYAGGAHNPAYDQTGNVNPAGNPVQIWNLTVAQMQGSVASGLTLPYTQSAWNAYWWPECGQQHFVLIGMLASLGIHGWVGESVAHNPVAYYSRKHAKWASIDCTFGEWYDLPTAPGVPLGPMEMNALWVAGASSTIRKNRLGTYLDAFTISAGNGQYTQKYTGLGTYPVTGFKMLGAHVLSDRFSVRADASLARDTIWLGGDPSGLIAIAPGWVQTLDPADICPDLTAAVTGARVAGGFLQVQFASRQPAHAKYQLRVAGGAWGDVAGSSYALPLIGGGTYEVRGVDSAGNATRPVRVEL